MRPAGLAARGWPWCRGWTWLPWFLVGAAVCRLWAATGGRCSQAGAVFRGAVSGGWILRVGLGAVGVHARLLWVYGVAWWPECPGPVQWERQVLLDRVVSVVRVYRLCVAPWPQWERWQGLVVDVGVTAVDVMMWW